MAAPSAPVSPKPPELMMMCLTLSYRSLTAWGTNLAGMTM